MINTKAILHNIGASSIMVGVISIFRIVSVPLCINYWGLELYGEWIVLITLIAYFQMSDVGLNTATSNEYAFAYVNKKYQKCNILINNNLFFLIASFGLMFFVLIILKYFNFFSEIFQFKVISKESLKLSLVILLAQVFIGTINNLLNTIYKAKNIFARGLMIDNIIRVSENSAFIIGVITNLSIPNILLVILSVKVVGLLYKYFDANRNIIIHFSVKYFRIAEFKKIIFPALSFFTFPVASSMVNQGYTLIINLILGSVAVVLFNTTRTMISFMKIFVDIFHKSVWPELSLSYGRKDILALRKIHRITVMASIFITVIASVFLFLFGKRIYLVWTENKIIFNSTLFYLFILVQLLNILWSSSGMILKTTNNHKTLSLLFLILSAFSLVSGYFTLYYTNSISYLPISLMIIEVVLIIYVMQKSLIITNDTLNAFIKEIYNDIKNLKLLTLKLVNYAKNSLH